MRFLSVNNLRLGIGPGGIPGHIELNRHGMSPRDALNRAVELAIAEQVHTVIFTGETIASGTTGMEPLGPLNDAFATLQQHGIPVLASSHGSFTTQLVDRMGVADAVTFLDGVLDWHPPITLDTEHVEGGAIHIVPAALAEQADVPGTVLTMEQLDYPGAIWILTDPLQPDALHGEHALVIEPGSPAPLSPHETNRHGVWLIDTDDQAATLHCTAALEFGAIDVDISTAADLGDVEQQVLTELAAHADTARADGSMARAMLVDITLVGRNAFYAALPAFIRELEHTVTLEHANTTLQILAIHLDATPDIELDPLLGRPDPVGELARLIHALNGNAELNDAQQTMVNDARQTLLAVRHARVFGTVHDTPLEVDAESTLTHQAWALLDSLVRQRGIDS